MRKATFFTGIVCLLLAACVKNDTPTTPLDNTVDMTMAMSQNKGVFMNGPFGSTSGMASIYLQEGKYTLALENMNISNGPDLHVYLSKEILPVNFIDLGRLQSVSGNQLYPIPASPSLSQYKYALIHCQRYNHLFGSAELR